MSLNIKNKNNSLNHQKMIKMLDKVNIRLSSKDTCAMYAAIDKTTGKTVLIDDLGKKQRGLGCNCKCPDCGKDLVARMGEKNAHGFAHYAYTGNGEKGNNEGGGNCVDSSLKLLGIEVLSRMKSIVLDDYFVSGDATSNKYFKDIHGEKCSFLGNKMPVEIVNAEKNVKINGLHSDVLATCKIGDDEIQVNFRIVLSNKITEKKINEITWKDVFTVEIDLSDLKKIKNCSLDEIEQMIKNLENHRIIHVGEQVREKMVAEANSVTKIKANMIEKKMDEWVSSLNNRCQEGKEVLPEIIINEPDFSHVVDKYGKKVASKEIILKKIPNINIKNKGEIVGAEHAGGDIVNLICDFSGKQVELPLLVLYDLDRSEEDERYDAPINNSNGRNKIIIDSNDKRNIEMNKNEISFLEVKYRDLIEVLNLPISEMNWGRNQKIIAWHAQCQKTLDEFRTISEKRAVATARVAMNNLDFELKKGLVFYPLANKQKLINDLLAKGIDKKTLFEATRSSEMSPFMQEISDWRIAFLHSYLNKYNYVGDCSTCFASDFSVKSNELKSRYGIEKRNSFKEVMFASRVLDDIGIRKPFKDEYSLIRDYHLHLKTKYNDMMIKIMDIQLVKGVGHHNGILPNDPVVVKHAFQNKINETILEQKIKKEETEIMRIGGYSVPIEMV
jgi:hypothetical protein